MSKYYQDIESSAKALIESRGTDELIYYITGDRKPISLFSTQIHPEVLPIFYKLLSIQDRRKKRRISLLLNSNGGVLEAPWPIVNLIREYASFFEVLIPEKAHSAATLLSLGANKIVMTPLSTLSPIDPTGNYNIKNEQKSIQVEDIFGFIDLARDKVGLVEQNALSEMLVKLVEEVPPSVLGSTNRTQSLIRRLATKMLKLGDDTLSETEINRMVEVLTQRLYSHGHMIGRYEARKEIGLKSVDYATAKQEKLLNEIFASFRVKLKLDEEFDPMTELGTDQQKSIVVDRAILGNSSNTYIFRSKIDIQLGPQPGSINVNNKGIGWVLDDST